MIEAPKIARSNEWALIIKWTTRGFKLIHLYVRMSVH